MRLASTAPTSSSTTSLSSPTCSTNEYGHDPAPVPEHLPQFRYPADPWKFVEVGFSNEELPLTETLFAVGNGYLGLRGDHEEGRDANDPGTFINGFHETWSIHHAEQAFGFATTGQTIVNVPDPKIMSLYVDDEPLELSAADLASYERVLDLRRGTVTRDLTWRTAAGKLVRVRSQRLVSLVHRHIAAIRFEVTMEQGAAPVVIASRLLNRQDAEFEARPEAFTESVGVANPERDPRRHRTFNHRVLQPRIHTADDRQMVLGFQCTNSKMSIACAARHQIESTAIFDVDIEISPDEATAIVASTLSSGQSLKVTKFVSYHTSRYSPHLDAEIVDDAFELATRCARSLDRVEHDGLRGAGRRRRRPGSTSSGRAATSRCGIAAGATRRMCPSTRSPSSRRCAGTSSNSPRRRPRSANRGSPPRGSPVAATRATTSGTPRCTSRRSCRTPGRRPPGS